MPAPAHSSRPPGVLRLAAPLIVSFWLRSAFTLVDRFYAGVLEDPELGSLADASQAAIGLTTPIEFLMIACWVGASNGLTKRLSEAMGSGSSEKIAQLRAAAWRVTLALGAVFLSLALVIWFAPTVFAPASEPEVVRQFQIYATTLVGGSAFTMFWSILPDSLVKAHHDTVTTMWAGLISSFVNVAFNTFFVFVLGWGIFGIAFSSVLGRIGGLVYAWAKAAGHERRRLAEQGEHDASRFPSAIRAILVIAVPSGLTYVLLGVETLAINEILRSGPDPAESLAAWSVFDGLMRFFMMPPIAIGVALLPLVARWRGAGVSRERLQSEVRLALAVVVAYCLVFVAPVVLLAKDFLVRQLVDEDLSIAWATTGMWWLPAAVLFGGAALAVRTLFDAWDRSRLGLGVSAVRSLLVMIPLFLLGGALAPELGQPAIVGYYAAATLGAAIALVLTLVLLARIGAWSRRAPLPAPGGAQD